MSFYQNVFDTEFRGNLLLSDRQFTMTFKVGANPNSTQVASSFNPEPYDLSTNKSFTLNYSFDSGNSWTALTIADLSTFAVSAASTKAADVAAALNANSTFAALYTASTNSDGRGTNYVVIKSNRSRTEFRSYISNGNAEKALRFNKKAGVAELPGYFDRHTIGDISTYPDSVGMLIYLDPTTTTNQQILSEAGFTYLVGGTNGNPTVTIGNTLPFHVGDSVVLFNGTTTVSTTISTITTNTSLTLNANWTGSTGVVSLVVVHADYQLLRGRSGIFNFQNITVDGSDRITQIIEYPAGALPGDLARLIKYAYTGGNTHPSKITEQPYVLTSNDLVTP